MSKDLLIKYKKIIGELVENENLRTCGRKTVDLYAEHHKKRFSTTFNTCKKYIPNRKSNILDIGRSNLTSLLSDYYENVFSLGFDMKLDLGGHRENVTIKDVPHIVFDLNHSNDVDKWPNYPDKFDLIVFCETLEHISSAPEFILLMFKYLLKPNGKLILTTPNAVSFHKRVILLFGKNHIEKIRFNLLNPGDYRQYICEEIIEIATNCGLTITDCYNINFNKSKYGLVRLIQKIPQLKDSIMAVISKNVS